jgi:hypothetical protein
MNSGLLDLLVNFVLNIIVYGLVPTGVTGIFLKVQRKHHVYSRSPEGERELVRNSNVGLVGFQALFLLYSLEYWPGPAVFILRAATSIVIVILFYNQPRAVITVPEMIMALLLWVKELLENLLCFIPGYSSITRWILAVRASREVRYHRFSGPEISSLLTAQQLTLTQTSYVCKSCGTEKDYSQLGDIVLTENREILYFCDRIACRVQARDLYAKKAAKLISYKEGLSQC